MKEYALFLVWSALMLQITCSAGEFRNLAFDDGEIQYPPPQQDPSKALPGWTLKFGQDSYSPLVNTTSAEVSYASLQSRDFFGWGGGPYFFTEGEFSLDLYRAQPDSPVFTLEQAGTVPTNAQFLVYRSWQNSAVTWLQVQLGGDVLAPLNAQGLLDSPITNLVFDIARFAGQEATLAFVGPFGPTDALTGHLQAGSAIDSIQFVTASSPLEFRRTGNQLIFSWPASTFGYTLQSTIRLWPFPLWHTVAVAPVIVGGRQTVTLEIGTDAALFYRLGLSSSG